MIFKIIITHSTLFFYYYAETLWLNFHLYLKTWEWLKAFWNDELLNRNIRNLGQRFSLSSYIFIMFEFHSLVKFIIVSYGFLITSRRWKDVCYLEYFLPKRRTKHVSRKIKVHHLLFNSSLSYINQSKNWKKTNEWAWANVSDKFNKQQRE